jgi:hypothetical protein
LDDISFVEEFVPFILSFQNVFSVLFLKIDDLLEVWPHLAERHPLKDVLSSSSHPFGAVIPHSVENSEIDD